MHCRREQASLGQIGKCKKEYCQKVAEPTAEHDCSMTDPGNICNTSLRLCNLYVSNPCFAINREGSAESHDTSYLACKLAHVALTHNGAMGSRRHPRRMVTAGLSRLCICSCCRGVTQGHASAPSSELLSYLCSQAGGFCTTAAQVCSGCSALKVGTMLDKQKTVVQSAGSRQ